MQWGSATPGLLIILLDQSGPMVNKYDDNHVHELGSGSSKGLGDIK